MKFIVPGRVSSFNSRNYFSHYTICYCIISHRVCKCWNIVSEMSSLHEGPTLGRYRFNVSANISELCRKLAAWDDLGIPDATDKNCFQLKFTFSCWIVGNSESIALSVRRTSRTGGWTEHQSLRRKVSVVTRNWRTSSQIALNANTNWVWSTSTLMTEGTLWIWGIKLLRVLEPVNSITELCFQRFNRIQI